MRLLHCSVALRGRSRARHRAPTYTALNILALLYCIGCFTEPRAQVVLCFNLGSWLPAHESDSRVDCIDAGLSPLIGEATCDSGSLHEFSPIHTEAG